MDNNYLRIIANPYRLKKNKIKFKDNDIKMIEKNDLLYKYLELKYKDIYINPNLFYEIIKMIDLYIQEYEIKMTVKFVIDSVIIDNM